MIIDSDLPVSDSTDFYYVSNPPAGTVIEYFRNPWELTDEEHAWCYHYVMEENEI